MSSRLEAAGTARFTIKTTVDPSRTEEPAFRLPLIFNGEGTLDFRQTRAAVSIPGQAEPVLVYDDARIYARRTEAVLQNDARKWGLLDFGERDVGTDVRSALGLNAVNPALLVELARGTSIGGIKATTEQVRGVTTTRYTARFAPLVAMEDHSAEERDALRRATSAAMGVRESIYPGAVWLDGEGLPRKIRFTVNQRVDRANVFATAFDLEIFDFGAPLTVDLPAAAEAVTTKSFGGLAAAIDIPRRAGGAGGIVPT